MPSQPQIFGDETSADSLGYAAESAGARGAILGYFLILCIAGGLGNPGGLALIPISYYLKDTLRLSPVELAWFGVIATIPGYFGFLPGFVRDRFRPRLMGDRFYLLVGATIAVAAYLYLGRASLNYSRLLYATLIAGIAYLIVASGSQALMAGVAQGNLMTGRLSVVAGVATYVPAVISAGLGGWLAHLPTRSTFLVAAGVTAVIALQSFWRLGAVIAFEQSEIRSETSIAAIARLARYRPIWPAAIFLLWNFGPGWGTPMFYHLTQTVKVSSQVYGTFIALGWLFFIPSAMLYAPLCSRFTLSSLLWWGTLVAILQGPIMFFARSPASAIAIAVLYGLFGGLPTAAYVDLIIRSCPKGLEGTAMMFAVTTTALAAGKSSDLLGSWIYARGGFTSAVIITTLATASIVPLLWWVPKGIASTREGEALDFGSTYSDA
jgi:hypothetical protein